MLTEDKFESHAARLVDPNITDEQRCSIAAEVRDAIEVVHSQEYSQFLKYFLPAFVTVLRSITKPQMEDNSIHKTRATILEVMHRFPHNDFLKQRCSQLLPLAMEVMRTDNEENSVTAVHIVFDLHKTFRPHLESQVEPFLSFVRQLYTNLPKTVDTVVRTPNAQLQRPRILPATQSFKVVTECPLVVMFVFQLYPRCIKSHITALLPLMLKAIQIEISPQQAAAIPKATFKELIAAQVKTVTFLVYLLKQVPKLMNLDEMWLPQSVVQLLKACPDDAFAIRKELLVATRHMLSSPLRKGFFPRIDALLDERVIAGTGRASTDALRPLGYAFLAELVHGLRSELKLPQLSKIISMFSTNLHDPEFIFSLQTSAARLLLNLVQAIMQKYGNARPRDPEARKLLVRIMMTMIAKYAAIGDQVPQLLESARKALSKTCSLDARSPLSEQSVGDPMKEINDCKTLLKTLTLGLKTVVWSVITFGVAPKASPKVPENIAGYAALKGASGKPEAKARKPGSLETDGTVLLGLLEEESEVLTQLLSSSQKCFKLYSRIEMAGERSSKSGDLRHERKPGSQGEKEIIDSFAQIFTILSVQSFQDIFGLRMGELLEYIMENPPAIAIAQQFLANTNISKYFSDILLNFAVTKMELLSVPRLKSNGERTKEQTRASTLLRLFRSLFASVPNFAMNEPVLRLHIGSIVRQCLSLSSKCEDPFNYLHLLRYLFKCLTAGGGKHDMQFDSLFRDFVPLVEPLLSGLLKLYNGPHRLVHRDLLIELCLIIPARPSTLFPHLGLQIKPMVWALTSNEDNVTYGLRALEFWLELLQPVYFDKLLQSVEPDLTHALQRHLRRPSGNQSRNTFATTALRILGKMGSRARKYSALLKSPSSKPFADPALRFKLAWSSTNGAPLHLNVDDIGQRALSVLISEEPDSDVSYTSSQKQSAWDFCRFSLAPYLGLQKNVEECYSDLASDSMNSFTCRASVASKEWTDRLEIQLPISEEERRNKDLKPRTRAMYAAEIAGVQKLLVAVICAGALPDFERSDASNASMAKSTKTHSPRKFVLGLARYFALLLARQGPKKTAAAPLTIDEEAVGFAAPTVIEPSIFLDALIDAMSLERHEQREAGLLCLEYFIDSIMFFSGYRRAPKDSPTVVGDGGNIEVETSTNNGVSGSADGSMLPKEKLENLPAGSNAENAGGTAPPSTPGVSKTEDVTMSESQNSSARAAGGQASSAISMDTSTGDDWVIPHAIFAVIGKLCHCCYQRIWYSKWAGAAGLGAIISRVPSKVFSSPQSPAYEPHIVRALMFVVRDLTFDVSYLTTKVAKASLEKLLNVCHEPAATGSPKYKAQCLRDVSTCLSVELVSDSRSARTVSKQAFRTLAKVLKKQVSEIMTPVKEQILRPLQNHRSIRQLSFPVQIGIVDAVSFCLQLENPVVAAELFSPAFKNSFLVDVINIPDDPTFEKLTEADDGLRHKLVENKLIHPDVVEHLAQLRRLSVELLSNVAVRCAEQLSDPANDDLFRKMISIFFKCLQSRDDKLVNTAKIGLKQAISQHQKPKETLQRNLRPVLSNLSDYKKLSLSYLQGLSRILELLSHWFNVNLGDKLLEHLNHWTEPQKIASLNRGAPGTEATIGAAIIDLFHLLPPPASKFIDALVYMVLRLECELGVAGPGVAHLGLTGNMAASSSPYRVPLLRFCNKHPDAAVNFFLSKLEVPQVRHLFFVLLNAKDADSLRSKLASDPTAMIRATFHLAVQAPALSQFAFYGVLLVNAIYDKTRPQWLRSVPIVLSSLLQHWNSKARLDKLNDQNVVSTELVLENRLIAEILIRFCENTPDAKETLFQLLKVFSLRTECDFSFVRDFLSRTVSQSYSTANKKAVLDQFLTFFADRANSQEKKVHALQLIVIPMVKAHLEQRSANLSDDTVPENSSAMQDETAGASIVKREVGQRSAPGGPAAVLAPTVAPSAAAPASAAPTGIPDDVLDGVAITRIVKELLDRPDDVLREYDEPLSAELLQLSTLLIKHLPTQVGSFRKELIKFGWAHLKREDSIAKQWAFVNVSRFFEAYQAPPKIILQVYVALLRAVQGDGKVLVRQALDILTPALPKRLEHNPAEKKCPIWIRYTKKVLLEEGHSIVHLVHIWQLIIRHAGLFYVAKSQFVPIMVNTLARIGLQTTPSVSSTENRRVALDLADLIISWKEDRPFKTHSSSEDGTEDEAKARAAKRRRVEAAPSLVSSAGQSSEMVAAKSTSQDAQSGSINAPAPTATPASAPASVPNPTPGPNATSGGEDFRPSQVALEVTGSFLGQVAFRLMDKRERDILANRCVLLLDTLAELCPTANLKLSNMDKLAEVQDKVTPPNANAIRARLGQANQAPGTTPAAAEAKFAAAMKTEVAKLEAARLERILVRKGALKAALEMCKLLIPAVADRNIPAARLFAEVLGNVLTHSPWLQSLPKPTAPAKPAGSTGAGVTMPKTAGVNPKAPGAVMKAPPPTQVVAALSQGAASAASNAGQAMTPGASSAADTSRTSLQRFYASVLETVERCLRSDDTSVNFCALIVLEMLLSKRPEEFLRFRDLLVKSFTRMVKENPVISQSLSSSSSHAGTQSQKTSNSAATARGAGSLDKSSMPAGSAAGSSAAARAASAKMGGSSGNDGTLNSSKSGTGSTSPGSPSDGQTMRFYLSILGRHISHLETAQRRGFISGMCVLIERCTQVDVLLEIVKVIEDWVTWRAKAPAGPGQNRLAQKEPLTTKEKSQFLLKMVMFERIAGPGSEHLMNSFLNIILTIFGAKAVSDRKQELLPKLERAFLLGLKSKDRAVRSKFFDLFDGSLARNPVGRLHYIVSRQEWLHLAESFWIKQAAELLVSVIDPNVELSLESFSGRLPRLVESSSGDLDAMPIDSAEPKDGVESNALLKGFLSSVQSVSGGMLGIALRQMLNEDNETAYLTWLAVFPAAWALSSASERSALESSLTALLVKEYHIHQSSWKRNVIQALLDGASKCNPPPLIPPEVLFHLGSRWNAWHTALPYLSRRAEWLSSALKTEGLESRTKMRYEDELNSVLNSSAEMYRRLNEKDFFAGVWKKRALYNSSKEALALEQRGQTAEAQELYSQCIMTYQENFASTGSSGDARPDRQEVSLWQERWVDCAKHLCQWDILTEFSRSVIQSDLMHECLWRVPDWSALKELLYRQPVFDGPTLRFYQAYVHIQENKLESAESSILQGYQKALERYCSLPQEAGSDSNLDVFVQFQQLVELQDSCRILGELNQLSRHGTGGVNVEQKIENVRSVLAGWRERLPAPHEPLPVWNKLLTWRNHVHAVVVNVLESLKEAANAKVAAAQNPNSASTGGGRGAAAQSPSAAAAQVQAAFAIAQSLPQQVLVMGVNETAWNIHRFARACRKQGQPNVAINALLKLYPFGTMELSEYFVKTKETAKSFMSGPSGLENNLEYGLNELNRCNMDHFNARQKAQLFTMKGKFYKLLGKDYDVASSYSTALSISGDVASGWLAWARHCDDLQKRGNVNTATAASGSGAPPADASLWREAAVNCYLQAVRFGSRKARCYVPRALRLLTEDMQLVSNTPSAQASMAATQTSKASSSGATPMVLETKSPPGGSGTKSVASESSRANSGVFSVFVNFIPILPAWIWLPWLTQIITMLSRKEAMIARAILNRIVPMYPQAVFFPLRAFMEERRVIDQPSRNLTEEALRSSKSNTSALLPAASTVQASNSARQLAGYKEKVKAIHVRLQEKITEQKALEGELQRAKNGTPEFETLSTRMSATKEAIQTYRRNYERYHALYRQQLAKHTQSQNASGQSAQQSIIQGLVTSKPQESAASTPPQASPSAVSPKSSSGSVNPGGPQIGSAPPSTTPGQTKQEHGLAQQSSQQSNPAPPRSPYEYADNVMAHLVKSHQGLYVDIERVAVSLSKRLKPHQEEQLLHLIVAVLHRCYQLPVQPGKKVVPSLKSALEEVSRMCFGTASEGYPAPADFKVRSSIADLKPVFEAELAPQVSKDFPSLIEPFITRLRRWKSILQHRVDVLGATLDLEVLCRHLVEIHGSDVEIFGQYLMAEATEVSTDSLITIDKFTADSVIVRRHSGAGRGVYVLGKDGKEYRFLIETIANTTVQPTEERAAQLCRLFNASFFARHAEAERRRTRIEVPKLIPTGQHTRLASYDPNTSSLVDGLEAHMESQGQTLDVPLMAFRNHAYSVFNRRRAQSNGQAGENIGREESIAARAEAYHQVCQDHVPESCLSQWLTARIATPNLLFAFQKKFAETLGSSSLICYALAVGARLPQNVTFSWDTGAVCNLHVRPLVSATAGVLECDEAVPFRLTRNIRHFIGPVGQQGPLFGSMAVTLEALRSNMDLLRVYLDSILHDELAMWTPHSRSSMNSSGSQGSPMRPEPGSLNKRLAVSVENVLKRLDPVSALPADFKKDGLAQVTLLSYGVNALIDRAGKPENLAEMEAGWQAWF